VGFVLKRLARLLLLCINEFLNDPGTRTALGPACGCTSQATWPAHHPSFGYTVRHRMYNERRDTTLLDDDQHLGTHAELATLN
jgi:hypothetical protein